MSQPNKPLDSKTSNLVLPVKASRMPPHDYPYWPGNHHYYRSFNPYRGPRRFMFFSRLFWFGLGAGAYSAWSRHKERDQYMIAASNTNGGAGEHNGEWKRWSGHHFGCHRQRFEQPPVQGQIATPPPSQAAQSVAPTTAPPFTPAAAPPQPPAPAPAYSANESTSPTADWQTERMREIGKQTSDAMAEMSENALDNLMTNIQALKAKIAKAREVREKERIYLEQRLPSDPSSHNNKQDRLI